MDRFLDWPPILWTLRIAILIVVIGGLHVFVLVVSRFFRWKTVRAMVLADPPRVESLGGEFAGAKAELKLSKLDEHQVIALREQVRQVQEQLDQLRKKPPENGGDG